MQTAGGSALAARIELLYEQRGTGHPETDVHRLVLSRADPARDRSPREWAWHPANGDARSFRDECVSARTQRWD
jgi:hypothetical protein